MKSIIYSLLILSFSNLIHADANHQPIILVPSEINTIGSATISTLNLPIKLNIGYGQGYFYEAPTNNEERYINQGYASLNVFHYVDAYRSFKQAYLENVHSIQALVGMSYAVISQETGESGSKLASNILNEAYKISLRNNLTEKEIVWLNFSKSFYIMKIGNNQLLDDKTNTDPSKAYQKLMEIDGNNLEAQTFINWILLNNNNVQYIKGVLEDVATTQSNHAGAQHYLLHISEMFDDISNAQMYGKNLVTLALKSAHAQHMYGHTLPQTGQWQDALKQFIIADKIHKDWANENNIPIHEDWHYSHNLDLLASTYLGLSDYENALKNWTVSMQYDARAIKKMIGLALATNQIELANNSLAQIEAIGPQYRNYVSFLRSEEAFLRTQKLPTLFPNTPFAQILSKTYKGNTSEIVLLNEYKNYFTRLFQSGGFDGWSNGFVELMRAKNIARKLNLNTLSISLENLESRARSGKF